MAHYLASPPLKPKSTFKYGTSMASLPREVKRELKHVILRHIHINKRTTSKILSPRSQAN